MYRKGVSALIVNDSDEFLLVNLKSFKEIYFAVPGGGIENGEALEDTAYRELYEELGIGKGSLELVGMSHTPVHVRFQDITLNQDGKKYEGFERYFFGFRFVGNQDKLRPQKGEVRTYEWVHFNRLRNYLLFDNQFEETREKIREIFGEIF